MMMSNEIEIEKKVSSFVSIKGEPDIGVMMPFQPTMQNNSQIRRLVRSITEKIKSLIEPRYSEAITSQTMTRLKNTFNHLYYGSNKKAVLITMNSEMNKVFYLDQAVNTKIIIDQPFDLMELLSSRKVIPQFLLLVLNKNWTRLYHFKNDIIQQFNANFNSCIKPVIQERLLQETNGNISLFYQSQSCPLVIAGNTKNIKEYVSQTPHSRHIVDMVSFDKEILDKETALELLAPAINNWEFLRKQYLINLMDDASQNNSLYFGIQNIINIIEKTSDCLLIIDKEQVQNISAHFLSSNLEKNNCSLESILEKFLKRHDRIEIMEDGMPKHYEGLVIIKETAPSLEVNSGHRFKRYRKGSCL